jgi:hypothetical protein
MRFAGVRIGNLFHTKSNARRASPPWRYNLCHIFLASWFDFTSPFDHSDGQHTAYSRSNLLNRVAWVAYVSAMPRRGQAHMAVVPPSPLSSTDDVTE